MRKDIISSVVAVVALTVIFGLAYPLVITGVSQVVFPGRADGSQIKKDGKVVGSRLLGQDFSADHSLFQTRPSPTGDNPAATAFSNLGPNSKDLKANIAKYTRTYLRLNAPYNPGLDPRTDPARRGPDLGVRCRPADLRRQRRASRPAASPARGPRSPKARVLDLVKDNTDNRALGLFGEPGVNVLDLNLAIQEARR